MKKEKTSTVRLKKETIKYLKRLGKFGESYDDIINKIIKKYYPTIKYYHWGEEDQVIINPIKKTGRILIGKPAKIKKQK